MSLLDSKWKYTHSTDTDIRKTFKKARKALEKSHQATGRPAKFQLMSAPADAANSATGGARPATRYVARTFPADGLPNRENHDQRTLVAARFNRHIGA
jgi:hypothetical protein